MVLKEPPKMPEAQKEFVQNLFQQHKRAIYSAVYKLVNDHDLTQDLVSEAAIILLRKADLLLHVKPEKLLKYIVTIAVNNTINYLRRQSNKNEYITNDERHFECNNAKYSTVEEEVFAHLDMQLVHKTLLTLPERTKTLLYMKYFEERPNKEIAAALGIAPDSIRMYLKMARDELREKLCKGVCIIEK